jgi:hypothetical protein
VFGSRFYPSDGLGCGCGRGRLRHVIFWLVLVWLRNCVCDTQDLEGVERGCIWYKEGVNGGVTQVIEDGN